MTAPPCDVDVEAGPIHISVAGTPTPQGSKKGFANPKTGRVIVKDDNPAALSTWRQDVLEATQRTMRNRPGFGRLIPVRMRVTFLVRRPPSIPKRRTLPATRPDLDKLIRSTCDALKTAGAYADDAQIVRISAEKRYAADGRPTGALITLSEYGPP
jgi:Holliday junction resolvase RusA-like endonuclease